MPEQARSESSWRLNVGLLCFVSGVMLLMFGVGALWGGYIAGSPGAETVLRNTLAASAFPVAYTAWVGFGLTAIGVVALFPFERPPEVSTDG